MKKIIIGSFVGAILLFAWSSLSWTVFGIHDGELKYTSAQDSLLSGIQNHIKEEGQYMIPMPAPGTGSKEMEEFGKQQEGKPWASIIYHPSRQYDMVMPIVRGFFISLVCVILICWIIQRLAKRTFSSVFTTVMTFAAICFLFIWYNQQNWFQTPWSILQPELIDLVVGWGLTGIWLGWWYSRRTSS